MKLKSKPLVLELLKQMLAMGMKVGEIQVIFPNINCTTLHKLGQSVGVNTRIRKDNSAIQKRDTQAIKKLIEEAIEDELIVKTPKLEMLLEKIDKLPPTPNGRTSDIRKRLKISNSEVERFTPSGIENINEKQKIEIER